MKPAGLGAGLGWLFLAIGAGGVISPRLASRGYGITTSEPDALAYVRAAAIRDVAVGSILLAVWDRPPVLRRVLWCAFPVSLVDALVLASRRGLALPHAIHLGGSVVMAALATVLSEPPAS